MLEKVDLKNFTVFRDLELEFSPGINIFIGKNSTGKTMLLKLLYSITRVLNENDISKINKEILSHNLTEKINGVFQSGIGRLVTRGQGVRSSEQKFTFSKEKEKMILEISYSTRHKKVEVSTEYAKFSLKKALFIPAKEILSMMSMGIIGLLEEYKFMDETYYDLAKALRFPIKSGRKNKEFNQILKHSGLSFIDSIVEENEEYYIKIPQVGKLESKLLAEGYKKLGQLVLLLKNEQLTNNGYLFWDEPEANINPYHIKSLVNLLIALTEIFDIQIFIATHNYFLIRYLDLLKEQKVNVKFFSLDINEQNELRVSEANMLDDLEFNSIIEEFDKILEEDFKSFQ